MDAQSKLATAVFASILAACTTTQGSSPSSSMGTTAGAPSASSGAAGAAVIPDRSETAAAAFRRLDTGNKGYITREDTRALAGFAPSFEAADMNHSGRLDSDEFRQAWSDYQKR